MANYARHLSNKVSPQSEAIPGENQVKNNAGGFVYQVDKWTMLDRFLVLGNEGGAYYATERKMTQDNAKNVIACIKEDGTRAVTRIVEISEAGRAPKNDPAIFALALAFTHGDPLTKKEAAYALPKVCRIGTHLFTFVDAVTQMRGWSRGLRNAVADWYGDKSAKDVAFQAVKYQQRGGWSHRDLLRLSHAKPSNLFYNEVYRWAVKGWDEVGPAAPVVEHLRLIWAFERAKVATSAKEVRNLITDFDLPREAVPTQFLTEAAVWDALLVKMPMEAMTRNLANMTRCGLLKPLSRASKTVADRLRDVERIKKSRMHPIKFLAALMTYGSGASTRSIDRTWTPVPQVNKALDEAFYLAFENVESTGKRYVLALDVSGSMGGGTVAGVPGLTPRIGSAAMAMVTAKSEDQFVVIGFTGGAGKYRFRDETAVSVLDITENMGLNDVVKKVSNLDFGSTDCALPMLWAMQNKVDADVFVVYTDNETWAGKIHPSQALRRYRQERGTPAKLVVCGMTATEFSIADPMDSGMLDVVGFDTATPNLISDCVR